MMQDRRFLENQMALSIHTLGLSCLKVECTILRRWVQKKEADASESFEVEREREAIGRLKEKGCRTFPYVRESTERKISINEKMQKR
jgi:hypothetical protein